MKIKGLWSSGIFYYDTLEFSKPVMLEDKEFDLNEKDILNSHIYKRAIKLIGERLPKEFQIMPQNY